MLGTKQNYGSDANDIPMREPFKWNAVNDTGPMTRYHLDSNNSAVVFDRFSQNNDGRSVEEQQSSGPLSAYRELIRLRHDNVALRRGSYSAVPNSDGGVWAFLRSYEQNEAPIAEASQTLVAAVNLNAGQTTTMLDLSAFLPSGASAVSAVDVVTGSPLPDITALNAASYPVTISGHGYVLVEAELERPAPPPIAVNGVLEDAYHLVASGPGGELHAAVDDTGVLYLATDPASAGADRFLLITDTPGGPTGAPWAKSGEMASPDAFVGNEADNGWSGWFDTGAGQGTASADVLEAAVDLTGLFGSLPSSVAVAAVSYETQDGGELLPSLQIPVGNGDLDIQAGEYIVIDLGSIEIVEPVACPGDTNGDGTVDTTDLLTLLANFGQPGGVAQGDSDGDGAVNTADLLALLAAFGDLCT